MKGIGMKQSKRVSTACPQCGTTFSFWPSWPRIYCSRRCAATAHNARRTDQGSTILTCDQCQVTFTRWNSQVSKTEHHFCSPRCFGDWQAVHKTGANNATYKRAKQSCSQCGRSFWRAPSQTAGYADVFCNQSCHASWMKAHPSTGLLPPVMYGSDNPRWKGGPSPSYYGPNWRPQRRNARHRDGYACQRCGMTEVQLGKQLDVHHIQPFRTFGVARFHEANRLANLISLCPSCHLTVEHSAEQRPDPVH